MTELPPAPVEPPRPPGALASLGTATRHRLLSLALGVPTWAVIALAVMLVPSAKGYGTHQQLGLGQCTILSVTGYPCPMCGMTTTFTHMAHLQPLEALATQPFGVVLFSITLFVAVTAVVELVTPRGRWYRLLGWLEARETPIAVGLLIGMVGGWLYKVWAMGLAPFG